MSLDHAIWFHGEPRFDDWLLFTQHSPVAHEGRGLVFGAMYTRTGRRLLTIAQEGVIRDPIAPG
jgi:acyl-CoA thioesterase-2